MRSKRVLIPLAAVSFLALGACQTTGNTGPRTGTTEALAYDNQIRNEVNAQLGESAGRAANALETLAMIQRARTEPRAEPIDESGLPPELQRHITVSWSGPALPLVQEIAMQVGYDFAEMGNAPARSASVQIQSRSGSAAQTLVDIGLQVQRYATVIVDPNAKKITFRHEPNDGQLLPPRHRNVGFDNKVSVSK